MLAECIVLMDTEFSHEDGKSEVKGKTPSQDQSL